MSGEKDKYGLKCVLCVLTLAQCPFANGEDKGTMTLDKRGEGLMVMASVIGVEQLLVAVAVGLLGSDERSDLIDCSFQRIAGHELGSYREDLHP